jgi:SAM-dependent methyltransferase
VIKGYDPKRYVVETVTDAIDLIVSPTEGMTAERRWIDETVALMKLFERFIERTATVLDYGCGIGRLAKPLIEERQCRVVGIDISPSMRGMACHLVDSPDFCTMSPDMFDHLVLGEMFDAAISVWALQHCADVDRAVARLYESVFIKGKLIIVNNRDRCVPVRKDEWADDGLDVNRMILDAGFHRIEDGVLDESVAPGWMQKGTFWAAYEKR